MKKIFICIIPFILLSCSSNKCIKNYLKEELTSNSEKKIISVLTNRKLKTSNTLNIYIGRKKGNWNTQTKFFNQKDYDSLIEKHKNDTLSDYWKKNESEYLNFKSLIKYGEINKYRDSIKIIDDKFEVFNYHLSKPIFISNKKLALFSIKITKQPKSIIEDCIIIMKKEKGKWIFLEKAHSPVLN